MTGDLKELYPVEIARDGGSFHVYCKCPECMTFDLHYLREPDLTEPVLIDTDTIEITTANGMIAVSETVETYDRWDERGFSVVRACQHCRWEWGQR